MTEPTDDLRHAVARAICNAFDVDPDVLIGMHGRIPKHYEDAADAAIAAYRQHPDGAAADRDAGWQDMRKCVFKAGAKP